jgi:hypothetical protein
MGTSLDLRFELEKLKVRETETLSFIGRRFLISWLIRTKVWFCVWEMNSNL